MSEFFIEAHAEIAGMHAFDALPFSEHRYFDQCAPRGPLHVRETWVAQSDDPATECIQRLEAFSTTLKAAGLVPHAVAIQADRRERR